MLTQADTEAHFKKLANRKSKLHDLAPEDRHHLVVALQLALTIESQIGVGLPGPFDQLREIAKWMREGAALLESAKDNLTLQERLPEHHRLVQYLSDKAPAIDHGLSVLSKPGHDMRDQRGLFLATASELVFSRLGAYHDQGLVELIAEIDPEGEPLDADALRKRRDYLKKHQPELYEIAKATGSQQAAVRLA